MRIPKKPTALLALSIFTTLATPMHAMNSADEQLEEERKESDEQARAEQEKQQKDQDCRDWNLIYDFYQAWVPNDPTDRRQEGMCIKNTTFCIKHKANVNADCLPLTTKHWQHNIHYARPLHIAAAQGFTQVAQLLLDAKADINAIEADANTRKTKQHPHLGNRSGNTPLHEVIVSPFLCSYSIMHFHDKHPWRLRIREEDLAAPCNKLTMIRLLIDNKADMNAQNAAGKTPLFLAVQQGCIEEITTLMAHQAAPYIPDNTSTHPLTRLMKRKDVSVTLIQTFLARGADPADCHNLTPDIRNQLASLDKRIKPVRELCRLLLNPTEALPVTPPSLLEYAASFVVSPEPAPSFNSLTGLPATMLEIVASYINPGIVSAEQYKMQKILASFVIHSALTT